MKRTISAFLSLIMAVCIIIPAKSAMAATNCFSISVSGTLLDSVAGQALDKVNDERSKNGLEAIIADSALEEFAQKRAVQITLAKDKKLNNDGTVYERCSDGTPMDFIFPDYEQKVFTLYGNDNALTAEKLCASLSKLCSGEVAEKTKSAGVGVFKCGGLTVYYVIYSFDEAQMPFTTFIDHAYSGNINVHYKYVDYYNYYANMVSNKYFSLSVTGHFTGYINKYLPIPTSQIIFKSNNPKVFKVIGTKGYIKKTGKYTLSVLDKRSQVLVDFKDLSVTINRTAPTIAVKSAKKRTLTVKWGRIKDGSGYEIQYSRKKNMKGAKTIRVKSAKKSKRIIKKLKSKKKYYVRVRAYIDQGDGEFVYSVWSKKKAAKIK